MLEPGDDIDIWVVEAALGTGGMGSVYRCHNRSAQRILAAVKVLDSSVRTTRGAQDRFVREAEILYQLDHPNIVKVRNIRIDSDPAYIEMEFVKGESLESHLRRGPLPFSLALSVMRELSDAVAYLHEQGVCHRDLKPANILIDERGRTRIVDFGLALESDRSRLTQAGMTFGTVSYAPPEWITPEDLRPQMWDLYGLGVIFWEILTGRVAFAVSGRGSIRQQAMQVIMAKQDHPPLDPGGRYHKDIRDLIADMTHSYEQARVQTMREVADRIQRFDESMVRPTNMTLTPAAPPLRGQGPETWEAEDSYAPATHDSDDPITLVRASPARGPLIAIGVAAVAAVALCSGVMAASLLDGGPVAPSVRDVDLSVPAAMSGAFRLRVDDVPIELDESGTAVLPDRAPGNLYLTWVQGDGCALSVCPGEECPPWCGTGTEVLQVVDGEGALSLSVDLPEAPEHAATLPLPQRPADMPVVVQLDGEPVDVPADGPVVFDGLVPGTHTMLVAMGTCPSPIAPCEGPCPDGCAVVSQTFVVPYQGMDADLSVDITPPEVPVAAPAPTPSARFVSHRSFSRWLASNPDYQRDAAVAAGLADANYLSGWTDTEPPDGAAGSPVLNVSWSVASAYCAGRGGLPDVEASLPAAPGAPPMEFRTNAGQPYVLEDGARHIPVQRAATNPITSFRCAG